MNSKLLLGTALVAAFFSPAVFAADAPMAAPMVMDSAPALDWTGFTVGIQAGVISFTGYEDYNDPAEQSDPYYSDFGALAGAVGLFVGYDFQVGDQFVLGVGGDINWTNASAQEFNDVDGNVYLDWEGSVQARAGVLATPDVLVYGLLGYSWAGFDASEYWVEPQYDETTWTGGGVKIGAGVEAAVGENMVVKAEAAVTYYDTHSITSEGDDYWDITPTVASAKVGLGWKF